MSLPSLIEIRPISLLPLRERLVLKAIKPDLLNAYGPSQFGFKDK